MEIGDSETTRVRNKKRDYTALLKISVISSLITHHGIGKSGFTEIKRHEWEGPKLDTKINIRMGVIGGIHGSKGTGKRK